MSELERKQQPNGAAPDEVGRIAETVAEVRRGQNGKHQRKGLPVGGVIAIALGALLLLAAGVGSWFTLYGYDRVYPGVTVCGADLSGMTEQEVRAALPSLFAELAEGQDLIVTINDEEYPVTVADSGIAYDAEQSARHAMEYGRTGGIAARVRAILRAWRGGAALEPVMTLNEGSLQARVHEIAGSVSASVEQPSWELDGDVLRIDKGAAGYAVDEATLLVFVREWLTAGDLSPAYYTPDITAPKKLDANEIAAALRQELREPSLDLAADPTGNTIISGQPGVDVDLTALQTLLERDGRTGAIKADVTAPKYTDEEYRALLFRDLLGRGKSSFDAGNVGRTTNVLLATEACNDVILLPGDIFSYNDTVGPRTYERGFKDAIVYVGTLAEAGVGGGICQVSSTIYYAVLRADLEIVERYAHSRTVTYVPLGEDATVAWGSKDFRFKNNTEFPIRVVTTHTGSSLTIELMGTQLVEGKEVKIDTNVLSHTPFEVIYETDASLAVGSTKVKSNGYSGYVTESYRVIYVNGEEVSRTFENKSSYTRYNKVILQNPAPVVNPEPVPVDPPVTPVDPPVTPVDPPVTPVDPPVTPVDPPVTPVDPETPPVEPVDPTDPPNGPEPATP